MPRNAFLFVTVFHWEANENEKKEEIRKKKIQHYFISL